MSITAFLQPTLELLKVTNGSVLHIIDEKLFYITTLGLLKKSLFCIYVFSTNDVPRH